MQVWEQEFAGTEKNKPIKLAARALTVPGNDVLTRALMKVSAKHGVCMQMWEQESAWTEADKTIKLAARQLLSSQCSADKG